MIIGPFFNACVRGGYGGHFLRWNINALVLILYSSDRVAVSRHKVENVRALLQWHYLLPLDGNSIRVAVLQGSSQSLVLGFSSSSGGLGCLGTPTIPLMGMLVTKVTLQTYHADSP